MSLLVVCEPIFQYVCRLNRSARKGGQIDPVSVRNSILTIMEEAEKTAGTDPDLMAQYEKVKMPLLFFIDYMIKESALPFADSWDEIAREYGEHAGDEKFYDLLDETLEENNPAANERLSVFYTCLGLGFTGFYTGQPEYLRRKMTEISGRIRQMMDIDETIPLCPEAYEHVDTSDLIEPPAKKLVGIGILMVGMIIVVFIVNITMFLDSKGELGDSLDSIIEHAAAQDAADSAEEQNP